jgi:hypothetical protein
MAELTGGEAQIDPEYLKVKTQKRQSHRQSSGFGLSM